MLDITEEQKRIFYSGTYFREYKLYFPDLDLTIGNDTLHEEAVTIKESICDGEDLTLGGCIASSCEFEVSEILQKDISGLEFTAVLKMVDETGKTVLELPMGKYCVDSVGMVDDKDYKKVTAYDPLYDVSVDVSAWYNGIFPSEEKDVTKLQNGEEVTVKVVEYGTVKLKAMRESLLQHFGIPYESQNLINDDMDVKKTIAPGAGSLPGTTVLKAICTVNGGFGRMHRKGKFEVIRLGTEGLHPEERLYPSDILYPDGGTDAQYITDHAGTYPEYRSVKYEEYECLPVTCLNIQTDEEDVGVTIGTDLSNPYLITGNFLLYGKSVEELKTVGTNILSGLQEIVYRPHTTIMNTLPYMEPGDMVVMPKEQNTVRSYVFTRTMTGIQAATDTLEAKGNKIRANEVTQESEVMQLKGRTLKIRKSIDGVSIEMANVEKKTSTRFEQTDEAIRLEAKRATDAEGELQSSIDLQADSIVLKVDSNGRLVEVALGVNADDGKNYFKVGADNISLTAEEVFDIISNGTLNLTGKKIKIESDNFSVGTDGHVKANGIEITGGTIHLSTSGKSESLIQLSNYDVTAVSNGKELDIKYFSEKTPGDYEHPEAGGVILLPYPQIGDLCFDVSGNRLYRFEVSNAKAKWTEREELLDYPAAVHWNTSRINTGNGVETCDYETVRLTVDDGNGNTKTSLYQNGTNTSVAGSGVHFGKKLYTTRNGSAEQQEFEGNITLEAKEYDESLKPVPELAVDIPVSVQSVKFDSGGLTGARIDFDEDKQRMVARNADLELRQLRIGNMVFKTNSLVRNFSADPLPSTGIIKLDAPGINSAYPVTVCNGDGEACPDMDFSNIKILSGEGVISAFVTKAVTGMARINYSYWAEQQY